MKKQRGIFTKPGSPFFWIRYVDGQGKYRREKAGLTVTQARTLLEKRQGEALQRKKLPETLRRRSVTVGELLDGAVTYARVHHRDPKRFEQYIPLLRELFGAESAESVTPAMIEKRLSKAASDREWRNASFNRHKAALSLAFRLAVEGGDVESNPARLVRQRREDNGRIRWLTSEEEKRLRAVIRVDYPGEEAAFDLALHTGMRRSEQYSLTWECVDLARRQITIPRAKNGRIRYIPLDDTAVSALLALRRRGDGTGPVMVRAEGGHGVDRGEAVRSPRMWFEAACRKAGVNFTWHCLRHSFASRLVMAGVSLRAVQELMGHRTISMTVRYAHLAPEHQLEAVRRLDGWGQKQSDSEEQNSTPVAPNLPGALAEQDKSVRIN
jgi:site-specific recombinase XerD